MASKGRPLWDACAAGDLSKIPRYLRDPDLEINFIRKKKSPLQMACEGNHLEIVTLLVKDPRVDPNIDLTYGDSCLQIAARLNSAPMFQALLDNPKTVLSAMAFEAVCEQKNPELLKEVLDSPKSTAFLLQLENSSHDRAWPFLRACAMGVVEIVKLLLEDERIPVMPTKTLEEGNFPQVLVLKRSPLLEACRDGHIEVVKLLLASPRIDVKEVSKTQLTPFGIACHSGNVELVKLLLDHEDVEVVETMSTQQFQRDATTSLHMACEMGHKEVVKILLASPRIKVEEVSKRFKSLIKIAAEIQDLELMRILLADNRVVIEREKSEPMLCQPCQSGNIPILQMMIHCERFDKSSLLVNGEPKTPGEVRPSTRGRRPLCVAASNGHVDVITTLIGLGPDLVDVNVRDSDGHTPLIAASSQNRTEAVQILLLQPKIDITLSNNEGMTAFLLACRTGSLDVVSTFLMDGRVNLTQTSKKGDTALHVACQSGKQPVVERLLQEAAIDVNFQNEEGVTPFFLAYTSRSLTIAEILLNDARLDLAETNTSLLKLLPACERGSAALVELLLRDQRTDINVIQQDSPLARACVENHVEVVKLLILDSRMRLELNPLEDILDYAIRHNHLPILELLMCSPQSLICRRVTAEIVNKARRYGFNDIAGRLEAYFTSPALLRIQMREKHGISESLALAVFLCDGFLKLKNRVGNEVRYMKILEQLPFELQMIICNYAHSRPRDVISLEDREKAFKALGKVYQGSERMRQEERIKNLGNRVASLQNQLKAMKEALEDRDARIEELTAQLGGQGTSTWGQGTSTWGQGTSAWGEHR